jgi:hypothetical protein
VWSTIQDNGAFRTMAQLKAHCFQPLPEGLWSPPLLWLPDPTPAEAKRRADALLLAS